MAGPARVRLSLKPALLKPSSFLPPLPETPSFLKPACKSVGFTLPSAFPAMLRYPPMARFACRKPSHHRIPLYPFLPVS